MKELKVSGRTVEEAIQHALVELGTSREKVEVTVLKEGKSGILGMGAEEAKIKVRPLEGTAEKENSTIKIAEDTLKTLLDKMDIEASVESEASDESGEETPITVTFNLKGSDLGILIGRRGQTLACLQFILRQIVAHTLKSWVPINIDVEGYKKRHFQVLEALANRIAEQVKAKKTPFTLRPMPAFDRRIIHLTLAEHSDVITESTGEGQDRRVIISPKETAF